VDASLLDAHLFLTGTAGTLRLVILAAVLIAALNLPLFAQRSRAMLAVAALGAIWLSGATTVGSLLLATATVVIGGSLAAWCLTTGSDSQAVRRWHQTATFGFVLLAAGAVLLAGLTGSLHLAETSQRLALRPYLPPVALPLLLGLVGVGLVLALLGEPGRFAGTVPPALTGWLTTAPLLGLVALLLRVLEQPAGPLSTWAVGILIVGGFLAATVQPRLERRLAWAATGQAGLALMIVVSEPGAGHDAAVQHLLVFVPAQFGALLLCREAPTTGPRHRAGLIVLVALLLILAALPPLSGWRARVAMLQILLAGDHHLAAGLVLLGTLLGIVVYIRPIVDFWRRDPQQSRPSSGTEATATTPWPALLTAVALLGVLLARGLGQWPLS
jgi:NADH:ubiquinone oxidoreductase subunit 2 (subunit N)